VDAIKLEINSEKNVLMIIDFVFEHINTIQSIQIIIRELQSLNSKYPSNVLQNKLESLTTSVIENEIVGDWLIDMTDLVIGEVIDRGAFGIEKET